MIVRRPDLSVVLATSRPKLASVSLELFYNQRISNLSVELITVMEGMERPFAHRLKPPISVSNNHRFKNVEGAAGAYAKDAGLAIATGEYVCFWDDDNYYEPFALAAMFSAAYGYDVGLLTIEQCVSGVDNLLIPPRGKSSDWVFGDIDTMCLCIKTDVAKQYKWADGGITAGTDFRYFRQLVNGGATVHYSPLVIGRHFVNRTAEVPGD